MKQQTIINLKEGSFSVEGLKCLQNKRGSVCRALTAASVVKRQTLLINISYGPWGGDSGTNLNVQITGLREGEL